MSVKGCKQKPAPDVYAAIDALSPFPVLYAGALIVLTAPRRRSLRR